VLLKIVKGIRGLQVAALGVAGKAKEILRRRWQKRRRRRRRRKKRRRRRRKRRTETGTLRA